MPSSMGREFRRLFRPRKPGAEQRGGWRRRGAPVAPTTKPWPGSNRCSDRDARPRYVTQVTLTRWRMEESCHEDIVIEPPAAPGNGAAGANGGIIAYGRYPDRAGARLDPRTGASAAARPYWNPYVVGVLLGLVLLATYAVTGRGLGATAAFGAIDAWLVSLGRAGARGDQRRAQQIFQRRLAADVVDAVPRRRRIRRRARLGRLWPPLPDHRSSAARRPRTTAGSCWRSWAASSPRTAPRLPKAAPAARR